MVHGLHVPIAMSEATTTITEKDRIIHSQYGTGTVVKTDISSPSNVLVDFDRRGKTVVDRRDMEPKRELLRDVEVTEKPEWADEAPSEWEEPLHHGEVEIELDFAEGVSADVDAVIEDGKIIIQYWEDKDD